MKTEVSKAISSCMPSGRPAVIVGQLALYRLRHRQRIGGGLLHDTHAHGRPAIHAHDVALVLAPSSARPTSRKRTG